MSKNVKTEKLIEFAKYIKDRELQEITIEILQENMDRIKKLPASLSGHYHLGETHEDHLIRTMTFASLFVQEFDLPQPKADVLYAGALLHDIANPIYITKERNPDMFQKLYGEWNRDQVSANYHPMLGMFIIGKKMIEKGYMNSLIIETAKAVSTHMSHWYKGNPMPETDVEKFLAMSDLLASRREIKLE